MAGKILCCDPLGVVIEVQCKITKGLPSMQIVGLGSKAVDEAKERVRAAFHSSHIDFPKGRILINLSPADVPKDGSSFDLAIALSIMTAHTIIPEPKNDILALGELSLDGSILPVRGIIGRLTAQELPSKIFAFIPHKNGNQARLVRERTLIPVSSLTDIVQVYTGARPLAPLKPALPSQTAKQASQFDEIHGQELAKRAAMIAGAGGHNMLLFGPPGTGKSMLAKALQSILPDLDESQMLESTHLHSLRVGSEDELVMRPPLRSPHHSSSNVSILGGGQKARPGEVSLAHNGILFLDELLEFNRSCIEALRQPMEDRVIHISRAEQNVTYPASFMLIATMNPCPCGYLGSSRPCQCSGHAISQYQKKLSGPIMDRIDLFVKVDDVQASSLLEIPKPAKSGLAIQEMVLHARSHQLNQRHKLNAHLTNRDIRALQLHADARSLLDVAATKLQLSPRSYFRILRVAQTISDLDNKPHIDASSIAESLQFRQNLPTL